MRASALFSFKAIPMEIIVYDLDGTLRDTSCGDPYVPEDKSKPENWAEWQHEVNESGTRLPMCCNYNKDVCDLKDVFIVTSSQFGTEDWLEANAMFQPDKIIERELGDCRHPVVYKKEWIDKYHADVVKWVDDSKEVCDYIRGCYPHIEVVEVCQPELTDLPDTPKQIELDSEEGPTVGLPKKDMKFDGDKPMYNLLPSTAVDMMAQVLTFGAKKYEPNSWQTVDNGLERYRAAALRHTFAIQAGEVYDSESGLPHAAHIMCCAAFILELQMKQEED